MGAIEVTTVASRYLTPPGPPENRLPADRHWSVYPPDSFPHWLTVIPVGSNLPQALPHRDFLSSSSEEGCVGTGVRCCPHEVSLSMHRFAISCSCSQEEDQRVVTGYQQHLLYLPRSFHSFYVRGLKGLESISFSCFCGSWRAEFRR